MKTQAPFSLQLPINAYLFREYFPTRKKQEPSFRKYCMWGMTWVMRGLEPLIQAALAKLSEYREERYLSECPALVCTSSHSFASSLLRSSKVSS